MTARLWHPWDANDNTEKDIEKIHKRIEIERQYQKKCRQPY